MQGIVLKGIDPEQKILKLPASDLDNAQDEYSAIIGKRMAETIKLSVGDRVLVRWR